MAEELTFMAVGDTKPSYDNQPPESIFDDTVDELAKADLTFVQCERVISERGTFQEAAYNVHPPIDPGLVDAYSKPGVFDIVGLANNSALDYGQEALVDSIKHLEEHGLKPLGVGADIDEAREPVIVERNGMTVAMLGYCSVLLPQYWATEDSAGCAPLRADTCYHQYEYQPGSAARTVTEVWDEDLAAMEKDIEKANEVADIVIMSNHWGIHWVPRGVQDYQTEIAHTAIDAGVDLIIGHHPHLLHGIEIYDGTPCLYSLGNFAQSSDPSVAGGNCLPEARFDYTDAYSKELGPNINYIYDEHSHLSGIAKATFDDEGDLELSIRPVILSSRTSTEPGSALPILLDRDDDRFEQVVEFWEWSSEPYNTEFELDGNELKVNV